MQTLHNTATTASDFHERPTERVESRPSTVVAGTRTGWPMRGTYLLVTFATIATSVAISAVGSNLVEGLAWDALAVMQAKSLGLLAVGLLAVAAFQRTYAAIPARPVRQFRGCVLGSGAVCCVEILFLLLFLSDAFASHAIANYATLIVATTLSVTMTAFNRAMCRMAFGSRGGGARD